MYFFLKKVYTPIYVGAMYTMQTHRYEISLEEVPEAYENMVTRAILTHNNELWAEAHTLSSVLGSQQIERCHSNVERWLRLHGVTTMQDHEKTALLLIQSAARRWLVHQYLKRQYNMYSRLAKLDSLDHCKRAISLERTLACAWQHIHSR